MSPSGSLRASLQGHRFAVVVIGGGINGVAIARQCALAGKRTLLLEQKDFASGTTSRSTRIIHGGLRYLEHGELGLVRESLRERERLLAERPNLVRPIQFALALPQGGRHSTLAVRGGLWLYGQMGGHHSAHASSLDRHSFERLLDSGQKWALFQYDDAQCEFPERLVAEWLCDAVAAGTTARNYTRVLDVTTTDRRVTGVRLRDELSGRETRVEADWVVNATGPWADQVAGESEIQTRKPMIGGVRGSHIVLPRKAGVPDIPTYTEAKDGRPIFVVPWNEQLLVGTTEVADHGSPDGTAPAKEEVEYLLASVNRIFPGAQFRAEDMHYAFAGVRPLPYSPESQPSAITRRAIIHDHKHDGAAGMVSIIGGKLTTAASLARECVRHMGFRLHSAEPVLAGVASWHALGHRLESWARQVSNIAGIEMRSARAIAEWQGRKALCIARRAASDPRLRLSLCEHTNHIVGETVEAMDRELAITLGDILLRRVPVALGACWNSECSRLAAARVGEAVGWDRSEVQRQYYKFELERAQFLRRPTPELSPGPVKSAA